MGVAQEIVPGNVPTALREVAGLERGRTTARETSAVKPVSDEVFQATLPHLPNVVADLLRLMRRTGMRPDEACSIRPSDIDRSGDVWLYRPRAHKTERHGIDRVVPIGPAGQAVLAAPRGRVLFSAGGIRVETTRLTPRRAKDASPSRQPAGHECQKAAAPISRAL